MQLQMVLYEPEGHVAYLTLNDPEKLNAISRQLREDLETALNQADVDDEIRVIVIKAAGRTFCSGYDMTPHPESGTVSSSIARDRDGLRSSIDRWLRIWNSRKPIIAQVHGACLNGGNDLVAACDIIFCADDAQFGHPSGRAQGVLPMLGMWPIKIGMLRSKEYFFSGDTISGIEAERLGLVNHAVPASELDATVRAYAERIAKVPADILKIHKHYVNRWFEVMGVRTAASLGAEFDTIFHAMPQSQEFNRIARERGLEAAFAWRDEAFQR